jgi:hypothetical protein
VSPPAPATSGALCKPLNPKSGRSVARINTSKRNEHQARTTTTELGKLATPSLLLLPAQNGGFESNPPQIGRVVYVTPNTRSHQEGTTNSASDGHSNQCFTTSVYPGDCFLDNGRFSRVSQNFRSRNFSDIQTLLHIFSLKNPGRIKQD